MNEIPVYAFINDDGIIYKDTVFTCKQYALELHKSLDKGWYPIMTRLPFVHNNVFLVRFKRVLCENIFNNYPYSAIASDIGEDHHSNFEQASCSNHMQKNMDIFELYEVLQDTYNMLMSCKTVCLDIDVKYQYSSPVIPITPIIEFEKPYSDLSERFKLCNRIFPSKNSAKTFCGIELRNKYSGITIQTLRVNHSKQ